VVVLLEYCVMEKGKGLTRVDGGVGAGVNGGCWESGIVTVAGAVLTCGGIAGRSFC